MILVKRERKMSKLMWVVLVFVVFIVIGNLLEATKDYHYEDAPCVQDHDCGDGDVRSIKVYDP